MAKRKQLSEDLKKVIVQLARKGKSLREISKIVGHTYSTVQHIVNKFKYEGSWKNLRRKPKERKLNERDERYIVQQIRREKLRSQVQDTIGKEMSNQTIRRVLWKHGYKTKLYVVQEKIDKLRKVVNKVNVRFITVNRETPSVIGMNAILTKSAMLS
ncbi:hypothetical protein ANN_10070 [Periplaneta americana]|uniref:Sleeping Beauty transposase HTH domain-containing protein n=1 Tax=Periplaneta americana TaxID=6978 RepID=A0ABQ8TP33_PERAM|nr:hypothetical protein ANN_10070 [Periplaneta americana]